MEEILSVLHEVDFLQEEIRLFLAVALVEEHLSCCLLELVVGPFDLFDVYFLFLIHFLEPIVHDLLLLRRHGSKGVEELAVPHDGWMHDDLVDHVVGLGDQLAVLVPFDPAAFANADGPVGGASVFGERGVRGWLLFGSWLIAQWFFFEFHIFLKICQEKLQLIFDGQGRFLCLVNCCVIITIFEFDLDFFEIDALLVILLLTILLVITRLPLLYLSRTTL